jgi:hypothetical protein
VGLRADMDALPMTEHNSFDWKSSKPGLMHGCGHDGHTAMLVGAARYLAETRNFHGTAVLIFQPGEEGYAGAREMIRDGLFERFNCREVYAQHNSPEAPLGVIGVTPGPMQAAVDRIRDRHPRPGRPWRTAAAMRRSRAGGGAHHHGRAKRRVAQPLGVRPGRGQHLFDAGGQPRRDERHSGLGDAGGHGAHLP